MRHPRYTELQDWLKAEMKNANIFDRGADKVQKYFQKFIPSQINTAITKGMEGFTRVVLSGSGILLPSQDAARTLESSAKKAEKAIENYVHMGMISGAGTSAGGIVTGLLDLPLLMSLKIKLIFEIGSHYGYDLKDPRERYFALMIFREAFSSPVRKKEHLQALIYFERERETLTEPLEKIDWKGFQQEYRDYIDLAKLLQFIPGIGIVIGATVNRQLMMQLGKTAVKAYELRYFQKYPEKRVISKN